MPLQLPRLFGGIKKGRSLETEKQETEHDYKSPAGLQLNMAIRFIEISPVSMCLVDPYGSVLACNETFRTSINSNVKKYTNILEIIAPCSSDLFYSQLEKFRNPLNSASRIEDCETIIRTEDGREDSTRTVNWNFSAETGQFKFILLHADYAIRNSKTLKVDPKSTRHPSRDKCTASLEWGRFKGLMETKTVASHFKQEQIKTQALKETLESKKTFIRYISHEIRTPLNVVFSGLELLLNKVGEMTAEQTELLSVVKDACEVAVDILNEVLTFEKLDGNLLELDKGPESTVCLVKKVCSMFMLSAKSKEIAFEVDTQQLTTDVIVDVDGPKIAQVLRNLISNAFKFTPVGGSVKVTVLQPTADVVRVEVQDSGVGMSREERSRLFNEVVQFNAKELQKGGGSGLGLYLSGKMIDMHGGAIGVDMEREGQGSMFYIELAVVGLRGIESSFFCSCVAVDTNHVFAELNDEDLQKGSHSVTVNHSPCPSCDHPSEQNFRILIVDDAALCRKFHIRTLKGNTAGEYVEANDGVEAVEKVKESIESRNAFSAILMDSSMPRMNGVDATRAIRALGYAGKIFAITGNGFTSDIDEFISAGADDVLVKPVTAESYSKIFASLQ